MSKFIVKERLRDTEAGGALSHRIRVLTLSRESSIYDIQRLFGYPLSMQATLLDADRLRLPRWIGPFPLTHKVGRFVPDVWFGRIPSRDISLHSSLPKVCVCKNVRMSTSYKRNDTQPSSPITPDLLIWRVKISCNVKRSTKIQVTE